MVIASFLIYIASLEQLPSQKEVTTMLRPFKTKDIDQVMEIWLSANIDAHSFISSDYWKCQYNSVKEQILQANIYVYEQDKKIVGFAGMVDNYLAGIFVDKKYRSMGIGKKLLNYIKENYSEFTLNVYEKNKGAVSFYLREGLTIVEKGIDENTSETDYTMVWKQTLL